MHEDMRTTIVSLERLIDLHDRGSLIDEELMP